MVQDNEINISYAEDWVVGLYNECGTQGSGYKNNTVSNNLVTNENSTPDLPINFAKVQSAITFMQQKKAERKMR